MPDFMRIAYLINQYPKVSHSFIRREMLALERAGVDVVRVPVRGWNGVAADAADELEKGRTRYLAQVGAGPLLWAMLVCMVTSPWSFIVALAGAARFARGSLHLVYLAEACLLKRWMRELSCDHGDFLTQTLTPPPRTQQLVCVGRPVISTYLAGIAELVHNGINGWLIPAGDVQALADAMRDVLTHDDRALAAIGERAHERAVARHSIDAGARKLVAHLHAAAAA